MTLCRTAYKLPGSLRTGVLHCAETIRAYFEDRYGKVEDVVMHTKSCSSFTDRIGSGAF